MLARAFVSCLLLGALASAARPVDAASPSVSYSTWIVSGDTVMLRFVLPVVEAERLTGAAIPVLTVSKLGDYVLERTAVSASGRDCPAIDQGYDLGRVDPVRVGAGLYGFEILFRCGEPPRSLVLENHALFDRVPGHVNFARIEVGHRLSNQLFTAGRQGVHIADLAAVPSAGLTEYVGLGILHVLRDAARLCFLVAALLALRRPRAGLTILAGLAAGYALALAVQALGHIVPEQPMVEAFVGFLVALCAVAALAPQLGRPRIATAGWPLLLIALAIVAALLRAPRPALVLAGAAALSAGFLAAIRAGAPRKLWALPALVLGFLDGFALSALLAPLALPAASGARMSIGYDLGSLLASAGVLALLAGAWTLASRFARTARGTLMASAAAQPSFRRTQTEVLAAAVFAGFGVFWLVIRVLP